MRSFAEMPVWLLSLFGAMFAVMVIGVIAGVVITLSSKDAMDKAFGVLTLILSMFISIPVFLVGLITTVPVETSSNVSVGVVSVLTEIIVWSSLIPLVVIPAFIGAFLINQYHQVVGSSKSKKGNSLTIFERYRNPAKTTMNNWRNSRAEHHAKQADQPANI